MSRTLDTFTLNNYAREYAVAWIKGHWPGFPDRKRPWLMQEFFKFTYKDEWTHLIDTVKSHLKGEDLDTFSQEIEKLKTEHPRTDAVFRKELADRLAIDEDGDHIPGKIGTSQVGGRVVGKRLSMQGSVKDAVWPVYAGEQEERAAESDVADPLPEPGQLFSPMGHLEPVQKET